MPLGGRSAAPDGPGSQLTACMCPACLGTGPLDCGHKLSVATVLAIRQHKF